MKGLPLLLAAGGLAALAACGAPPDKALAPDAPASAITAPSDSGLPAESGWNNPDIPLSRHQADIEACHDHAWARVDRDLRIDRDIQSERDTLDSGLGFSPLSRRVDLYRAGTRRRELFESCMQAKGYVST